MTVAPKTYEELIPKGPVPTIANPHPGEVPDERGFWYDTFHPQPADLSHPQSWRDWATKTYTPTATDYGSTAADDFTMGGADYGQSKTTGESVEAIRARTEASRRALGPMAPIVGAASYVAGPGKILGPLAAIGKGAKTAVKAVRAGVEAFGAGAASSEGITLAATRTRLSGARKPPGRGSRRRPSASAAIGSGGLWGHVNRRSTGRRALLGGRAIRGSENGGSIGAGKRH